MTEEMNPEEKAEMARMEAEMKAEKDALEALKAIPLTIEGIANVDDLPTKVIPVPAWGGSVTIKMLTKSQQHTIRVAARDDKTGMIDEQELELGILVASVIQPDLQMEHIPILLQKNGDVVDELLNEVFSMSAIDKKAVGKAAAEFQDGPGEVDGVLPGGEAGDDGEATEAGDDDS